ncbi:MAG: sodium-translocating pyrophosphatase [Candidatus Helarchaeota archaeon]
MPLINELLTLQYLPFILLILSVGIFSIGFAIFLFFRIKNLPEGTPEMQEIASHIREGAQAYLHRQFKTIILIGAIIATALAIGIDYIIYWRAGQFSIVFIAFIGGTACSLIAGYIAMQTATNANVRVTNLVKKEGISGALRVAFNGGLVMGLAVVGLSLLSVIVLILIISVFITDPSAIEGSIVGLAFGASFAALFALLGGGIYTKAADVGADLVGKIEAGIPEDDPRNPGVIADNVGDNVGDIAGRGADLFESMTGQFIATIVLAVILFEVVSPPYKIYAIIFPLVSCALGLVATLIGTIFVRGRNTDNPWNILIKGLYVTTAINVGFFLLICLFMFQGSVAWFFYGAAILGLIAALAIGFVTLYYTDERYRPVKRISKAAEGGPATATISGLALGMESTGIPILIMIGALFGAYFLGQAAGTAWVAITPAEGATFGTAIGALGLFSVCGMVLALDGYGPIVDNAGGIAEMAQLEKSVRKETDRLDSCGNTTKAYTKGYAIATVALAAILLFEAYSEVVKKAKAPATVEFLVTDPLLLGGLFMGTIIIFVFSSFAMRAVGDSASDIINEIRRQFHEIPGLKEGKEGVLPEYAHCVDIATVSALKHMIIPGSLIIISPLIVGFALGPTAVAGFLIGAIITGLAMALFLNNGGGALDNAKKLCKSKLDKSDPHSVNVWNAAVQGDIVGDPMKDTAGPSINVVLTLILTIALQFAVLFVMLH